MKKFFMLTLFTLLAFIALGKTVSAADAKISIWVGSESAAFYQEILDEQFAGWYQAKYGKSVDIEFDVTGQDTGGTAEQFLTDPEAGADIFVCANDNLGKLLDGSGQIGAITSQSLLQQMKNSLPESFTTAVYMQAGDGSQAQFYGVPLIAQSLVLYYNKEAFPDTSKLATWEGIMEVAKAKNVKATSFAGSDGFNYSLFLLAEPKSQDALEAFGKFGTLKIYKNGSLTNCYNWGDDQVALSKYAQRFITDPNGRNGLITTNDGYATELSTGAALTFVGGAWHKGAVISSLGKDNWGVTQLPSFTLTEADAYGDAKAGMEFWSGTFADCKCMVKKKSSQAAAYLDDVMEFLSSDPVELESYKQCDNLPASSTVVLESDGSAEGEKNLALAVAQQKSAEHGIVQPFGVAAKFNMFYYQQGAPDMYQAIHCNTGGIYDSDLRIKRKLQEACYVWTHGQPAPDNDSNPKKPSLNTWLTDNGYDVEIDPRDMPADEGGEETKKKGCGSAIATGNVVIISMLAVVGLALIALKATKKREQF